MGPIKVIGKRNVEPADEEILAVLKELRTSRFRSTFRKRLAALDVEYDLVRHDWHDRLSKVKNIVFADEIQAHYHFRKKTYQYKVNAGFDSGSGLFWVKRSRLNQLSSLYESLAKQLVFKSSAGRINLLSLERAVQTNIRDPSFGRQPQVQAGTNDKIITDNTKREERNEDEYGLDNEPGEAAVGHSPFKPDPMRNKPKPGPIPSGSAGVSKRTERKKSAPAFGGNNDDNRSALELEKEHIEDLKCNQYASHCQMCLCKKPPRHLAPNGSYIQWEEVRRRVIEAHHVDLKSAGGARHAGNLILLCKLHHDNFGRRLTREAIVAALKANTREKVIGFEAGWKVKGRQIEISIADTGESVNLFFTTHHAEYWTSQQ